MPFKPFIGCVKHCKRFNRCLTDTKTFVLTTQLDDRITKRVSIKRRDRIQSGNHNLTNAVDLIATDTHSRFRHSFDVFTVQHPTQDPNTLSVAVPRQRPAAADVAPEALVR